MIGLKVNARNKTDSEFNKMIIEKLRKDASDKLSKFTRVQ